MDAGLCFMKAIPFKDFLGWIEPVTPLKAQFTSAKSIQLHTNTHITFLCSILWTKAATKQKWKSDKEKENAM